MFAQLAYALALIATTIAVPLNSNVFPSSTTINHCIGTLALLEDEDKFALPKHEGAEDATEMPPDRFMMKRFKFNECETEEMQPAVRLSSFPNSGTTWIQYLLEEATKIGTQSILDIMSKNGGTKLNPGEPLNCRAECGAQVYLHPNCTAGSADANNVTPSSGATPEIFKDHYPDFIRPTALFETDNAIQTTILLARNPLDTYLASYRHTNVEDPSKVEDSSKVGDPSKVEDPSKVDTCANISGACTVGYIPMRNETLGKGIDPLHLCFAEPEIPKNFTEFLSLWCRFFTFWLKHPSVGCTEVTVVRYEDLASITGDVLETILHEAGLSPWQSDGINRSVNAFPPHADRLSYDIYFNETLYSNDTIKQWANMTVGGCGGIVKDFGYMPFLEEILEPNVTKHNERMPTSFVRPLH